jgi:hypothetical protein
MYYPVGAPPQIKVGDVFSIPPGTLVNNRIVAFVSPLVGMKGKRIVIDL